MNERIRELMSEAVTFRLDPDSNAYEALIHPEDLEVFAEFIVRECIDAAVEAQADFYIVHNIKSRFGVEE